MNLTIKQILPGWIALHFALTAHGIAYQPKQTIMMPMRDGVRLATDVYLPSSGKGPWPTILVRTPYGRGSGMDQTVLFILVDLKGYALAMQDLRGRGGSEGIDSLFFSDGWGRVRDGFDAVEGIAQQSWCNGKIGTWGASGLGIPQYLASGTRPPHLACCCVIVAASNLYEDAIFYGGVYQKALVDGWLSEVKNADLASYFIQYPNYNSRYDIVNLSARWDSVSVPILHVSGWHDIFVQGIINAFSGIQEHGGPGAKGKQKLIIGPWVHDITSSAAGELIFPNSSYTAFLDLQINWFDHWLKNVNNGVEQTAPAQYYVMGDPERPEGPGNRWISSDSWPPPSNDVPLYLSSGGKLSFQKPFVTENPDIFSYNPGNPVPTLGGRNLNIKAGSYDQRPVEFRPDVLTYTTEPLADAVTIAGRIRVKLWASTDAADTDFSAKLCDVFPDGRSMLVADGIVQARHRNSIEKEEFIQPNMIYEFTIDLWSAAIAFAPGHSIRVDISSSNDPRFEPNPNTGEPFRQKPGFFRTALQTVYRDPEHASAIHLPVVSGAPNTVRLADRNKPDGFSLGQNYPNPFNSGTFIPVMIPGSLPTALISPVKLTIIDVRGRSIRQWTIGQPPGKTMLLDWDGKNDRDETVPSGVYFACLTAGHAVQIQKMTLLR